LEKKKKDVQVSENEPHQQISSFFVLQGIYFADVFSKSAHYCRAGWDEQALMLLCEVAVGKQYKIDVRKNKKKKKGKHCCKSSTAHSFFFFCLFVCW
jgi:hypothetical protein